MQSIYFNHIPRTGGTTLSRMLQNSGINKCGLNVFTQNNSNKNSIEFEMSQSHLIMGHYGIAPSIFNPQIDTITLLRNPVDQVVSMFSKLNYESKVSSVNAKIFEVFRMSKFKDDPVNLFREWLHDERSREYTNNGQIYNLINTRYPYLYDLTTKKNTNKETQTLVTSKNAKEAVESLLFLGSTEKIYDAYIKIVDIVDSRFGTKLIKLQKSGVYNSIADTKDILATLSKSEKEHILENNSIDNQYWEQALNS